MPDPVIKAFVTGGTGFIGSHVVDRLLSEGLAVRLLFRRTGLPGRFEGKNIELVQGDLRDPSSVVRAMEGADLFFHIGEIRNITRAESEKNIELVEKITAELNAKGIRRFILVSSLTVAGIPSELPAKEDTAPSSMLHDHYTEYKRRCEEIIREKTGECEFAIIRPAPVYGPGSRYLGNMVNVVGMLGPIGLPFIGSAANIAPLIQVKDLARAIVRAGIMPAAAGQVFNITDGMTHTWADLFHAIGDAAGRSVRIIPVPPLLLKFAALPFDLFSGVFGMRLDPSAYLEYFSRDLLFDTAKAQAFLGWHPEYSLTEGVADMVAFYKTVNREK
jgi:nucleoside-diphosphate-sugar epimerase